MRQKTKPDEWIKIGTMLRRDTYRRLKLRAAQEGRSISDLVEEAVDRRARGEGTDPVAKLEALKVVLNPAWKMSREDMEEPVEDGYYGQ